MKVFRFLFSILAVMVLGLGSASAQQTAMEFDKAGVLLAGTGDYSGAIADYNKAIGLDPKLIPPYVNRGFAKLHMGDINSATADFTQAITMDAKHANAYYGRALAQQAAGDPAKAAADYQQSLALNPSGPNPHFYLWITLTQSNKKAEADKELSDYLATLTDPKTSFWMKKIGGFLLGQVTEGDLENIAATSKTADGRSISQSQAWYFAGMKKLIAGDKAGAAELLKKSVDTKAFKQTQYVLAKAQLQSLELSGH